MCHNQSKRQKELKMSDLLLKQSLQYINAVTIGLTKFIKKMYINAINLISILQGPMDEMAVLIMNRSFRLLKDSNTFYGNVLCRFKKIWHHIIGIAKFQVVSWQNSRFRDFHKILEFLSATRKLPDQLIWHLHQPCAYTMPKYCESLDFVLQIGGRQWL